MDAVSDGRCDRDIGSGGNVLAFLIGDGWYRGRFGVSGGYEKNFGDNNHLLCELHIQYEDGTSQVVASDGSFRYTAGPVLFSSIYDGEIYDAAALPGGSWMLLEYEDHDIVIKRRVFL